jgi:hypothetical protein
VGDLAVFAGGLQGPENGHLTQIDHVNIYNAATGQWSTAQLSVARQDLGAATVGDLAIFAGGFPASAAVDIYNSSTGQWSSDALPANPGYPVSGTSIGSLALFASDSSNIVNVLDTTTGRWFVTSLAKGHSAAVGTAAGGKALFAGGTHSPGSLDIFTLVPGVIGSISGKVGRSVSVTVQSTGDAALPAGATVSLYASPDGTITGATLLGTTALPSGLAAQASTTLSISTSMGGVPAGKYHLIAAADDNTGQGAVVIATRTNTFTVSAAHARRAAAAHPFAIHGGTLHGWPVAG